MYTTCSNILCGRIFYGEAHAFTIKNEPVCAGCFNNLAYGKPNVVNPRMIPLITDLKAGDNPNNGFNGFPPPTMV